MGRALLICVVLGAVGCGDQPSKDQCAKLFEKVVDLEIKSGGGDSKDMTPEMKQDLERRRKEVIDQQSEKFISTCTSRTPKKVVECQLGAQDLDEYAKCE